MASVYILYSAQAKSYYVGSCVDFEERFQDHLTKKYKGSFTTQANDWEIFFKIDNLEYSQARNIEMHIKRMKSRKYIENLKEFPSISIQLIEKYRKK